MSNKDLPDVAKSTKPAEPSSLDWVGMKGIVMPLNIKLAGLPVAQLRSVINCSVSLIKPDVRGIHMSRMYISLTKISKLDEVDYPALEKLSDDLVQMQANMSNSSSLSLAFNLCLQRNSLITDNLGWLDYPVEIIIKNIKGKIQCQVNFQIVYSSTCPCSAALARQLVAERFHKHFSKSENENGDAEALSLEAATNWLRDSEKQIATPHSQRSIASIGVVLSQNKVADLPILNLIETAENAIKTRVQAIVKREDEQAFASLNGENLMFCEDAARVLSEAFSSVDKEAIGIKVCHLESLHPHDAVAEVQSGQLISPLQAI